MNKWHPTIYKDKTSRLSEFHPKNAKLDLALEKSINIICHKLKVNHITVSIDKTIDKSKIHS